jgi:hypothetical protein
MYVVTTNTGGWVEGTNTEIRIEFDDDAKAEADKWSGPTKNMLEKCAWRVISERWDEVSGDSITIRLSRFDVLGLIERLRVANKETPN